MKITAITKFKFAPLYHAIIKADLTHSELARLSNISRNTLSQIFCLRTRPSEATALKIEFALGEFGIYINILDEWDKEFKGFKCNTDIIETQDVPINKLLECNSPKLIEYHDEGNQLDVAYLYEQISKLEKSDQDIINNCYIGDVSISVYSNKIQRTRTCTMQRLERALDSLAKICGSNKRINCKWHDSVSTRLLKHKNRKHLFPATRRNNE